MFQKLLQGHCWQARVGHGCEGPQRRNVFTRKKQTWCSADVCPAMVLANSWFRLTVGVPVLLYCTAWRAFLFLCWLPDFQTLDEILNQNKILCYFRFAVTAVTTPWKVMMPAERVGRFSWWRSIPQGQGHVEVLGAVLAFINPEVRYILRMSLLARVMDAINDLRSMLGRLEIGEHDPDTHQFEDFSLATAVRVLPLVCMGKGTLAAYDGWWWPTFTCLTDTTDAQIDR